MLALAVLAAIAAVQAQGVASERKPNQPSFILVLVDDLDATMDSLGTAMPATNLLLRDRGVTFAHHLVTTPICCPSRVNLLRGQLAHNTNFTDVLGPHGGYAKFKALGLDRDWLPGWLQGAGYNTLYTGKFIVDYTIRNYSPPPAGWTAFDASVHPFTFEYYCPAFSLNGQPPRMYPAQYITDVLAAKAGAMLRSAAADPRGRPFFLQVAPAAPHHSMHYDYASNGSLISRHWYPPVPAARHWEELSGAALPRPPSFNEADLGGRPEWMRALARLSPANETFLEEVFRLRLRSLRAVDELVEGLVSLVDELGLANSTYIAFTSDNGYHEGVHRFGSGKTTPYEEDLRVPLLLAGPGLRPGSVVNTSTAHIDIAPTLLALAGAPLPPSLDGTPLPLAAVSDGSLPPAYTYGAPEAGPPRNQLGAEFWGVWDDESIHSHAPYRNMTWRAVRVLRSDGAGEGYKYIVHCSGEYELYDIVRDPYEMTNLLMLPTATSGASAALVGARAVRPVRLDEVLVPAAAAAGSVDSTLAAADAAAVPVPSSASASSFAATAGAGGAAVAVSTNGGGGGAGEAAATRLGCEGAGGGGAGCDAGRADRTAGAGGGAAAEGRRAGRGAGAGTGASGAGEVRAAGGSGGGFGAVVRAWARTAWGLAATARRAAAAGSADPAAAVTADPAAATATAAAVAAGMLAAPGGSAGEAEAVAASRRLASAAELDGPAAAAAAEADVAEAAMADAGVRQAAAAAAAADVHGAAAEAAAAAAAAEAAAYLEWLRRLRARLDGLLAVLAVCGGEACSRPFEVLHPEGGVHDLWAAMDERYDDLYGSIEPFAFGRCLPYQDTDNERSPFRGAVLPARRRLEAGGRLVAAAAGAGAAAAAGGAGGQAAERPPLPLLESEVEEWAVPLPKKYVLATEVYGDNVVLEAMWLA
ncbi:hypothetical protein HYH03_000846 [Edaphochlamys debaryana]|uniref:Sulfatase N-terminal domain-containing protein n=1 Tax=Edaphochlamys debaryana TaxID=47281 RepID=A0A836C5A3_9CHLO|nr:hypothetical protein HYH03_000846 [Edaphochlamys debaryana]|eukprot:KAG2501026.1 hypothetical protein HYH03_000846 [Edaphochlamys debaryana]